MRIISTEVKESNEKSTSPATTACICGAVPLYWALTMPGAPITFLNCSVISEIMLLPEDTLSGLPCLAMSTSSCRLFTGRSLRAMRTKPTSHRWLMGSKLASAS